MLLLPAPIATSFQNNGFEDSLAPSRHLPGPQKITQKQRSADTFSNPCATCAARRDCTRRSQSSVAD